MLVTVTRSLEHMMSTLNLASRATRLVVVGLLAAAAGTLSITANAAPGGPGMHGGMAGMGMPFGGHPGRIERLLDEVNATADQRAQITQIMRAAFADLRAQREQGRALHDQARALFTAPTVDARAAEVLRQQMLAQHDQASRRMLQAMLDASRVLSPEQRSKLGELMAQRRAMMERHRAERGSLERPRQ
jgi:Spy/CpxP family protein refolding chaperone